MLEDRVSKVVMYSKRHCPYCKRAQRLLQSKGVAFMEISVENDPALHREMVDRSKRRTVPQIWIGDTHIGGCDELCALDLAGRLDQMLTATGVGNE